MENERKLLELVATDRIGIPIKSLAGKIDRKKPRLAKEVDLGECDMRYDGERVYAEVRNEDTAKARGIKEAVAIFSEKYPRHGKILKGLIEEQRACKEVNMYFGMQPNCKLTADDYIGVMTDLGFTERGARALYPELMTVSRSLARKRGEERSILVG